MDTSRQSKMPRYSLMIRELRNTRRLTQAELASQVGVKANTVARWESAVSEPDFWSYWSLHALAYLWSEWEIAEFFSGRMELSEARSNWDRRHLLRNLASVRDSAAAGDETAARLLVDSELDRTAYLANKATRITELYNGVNFPPELNAPLAYGLSLEQESALYDKYASRTQEAILREIREIELTDILREGREWEVISMQEAELKREQLAQREKARDVRKRFEAFRRQRQKAKRLLKAAMHVNIQAPLKEHKLFYSVEPKERIAFVLGVLMETGKRSNEPGGEDGTTKHDT